MRTRTSAVQQSQQKIRVRDTFAEKAERAKPNKNDILNYRSFRFEALLFIPGALGSWV